MNDTKSPVNMTNSLSKIKSNLERMSSIINRRNQLLRRRGAQPFSLKTKNFQVDSLNDSKSPINIIPKRIRSKNSCSRILLCDHLRNNNSNYDSKKILEDCEDSLSSDSPSREYKRNRVIGDTKNGSLYNYPTRKDVGLSSDEENGSEGSLTEENYSVEIERILIEIYNKNIKNIHNSNGKRDPSEKVELIAGEEEVRNIFYNFFILA